MIDRSMTRDTPGQAVALEAAKLFGTCAAETNLASACKQAHQQAGHMCASDPIKLSLSTLVRRRPSTYVNLLAPTLLLLTPPFWSTEAVISGQEIGVDRKAGFAKRKLL